MTTPICSKCGKELAQVGRPDEYTFICWACTAPTGRRAARRACSISGTVGDEGGSVLKSAGKTDDGKNLIMLGLSHENLRRLKLGQPICVRTSELRLDQEPISEIVIYAGRNEDEMARDLAPLLSKDAKGRA